MVAFGDGMKIKDPAHAVRVLKAVEKLLEMGERNAWSQWSRVNWMAEIGRGMLAGIKAVLKEWEALENNEPEPIETEVAGWFVMAQAQSYVPMMELLKEDLPE